MRALGGATHLLRGLVAHGDLVALAGHNERHGKRVVRRRDPEALLVIEGISLVLNFRHLATACGER